MSTWHRCGVEISFRVIDRGIIPGVPGLVAGMYLYFSFWLG